MRNRPLKNLQLHKLFKYTSEECRAASSGKKNRKGVVARHPPQPEEKRENTVMSFFKKVFLSVKIKKGFAAFELT